MPAFSPMTWRIRYRLAISAICLGIEHVFISIGYLFGLIVRSFKDGSREGKSDREYRRNREYIRDYRAAMRTNPPEPREPWLAVVNRSMRNHAIKNYLDKRKAEVQAQPPGSPLDL